MVKAVHDSVKGRVRFKVSGLKRSERFKFYIQSELLKCDVIERFEINILTGSILIYHSLNISLDKITGTLFNIALQYNRITLSNSDKVSLKNNKKRADTASILNRRKLRKAIISSESQELKEWHLLESDFLAEYFDVDLSTGLLTDKAKEKLKRYGPNLLPESVPRSALSIFFGQFKSLPLALLTVAACISVFSGGVVDAIVIMSVVFVNATVGFVTENQVEKTIHSLKSLVRPIATVFRDGHEMQIGAENLVPGDVIILKPGSYVPADARLIESLHLSIDESALTGESMPVIKKVKTLSVNVPLADRKNMVFMGTLVTGGQGKALVVATGRFTEIGKIQSMVEAASSPETPLQRKLNKMGTQLIILSGFICFLVFLIGVVRGYNFLQMMKLSISLAVAAVPEGLPTVATTILTLGIRKMRKFNVLVRRLNAVETLGSVQTICLDKTGTITLNKMSVVKLQAGLKIFEFDDNGRLSYKSENYNIKNIQSAQINPFMVEEIIKLLHICCLCNESIVTEIDGKFVVNGSSTENALINAALSLGINVLSLRERYPLIKIQHRSDKQNFMVSIHAVNNGTNKSVLFAIKGSPDEVLNLCSFYIKDDQIFVLTEEERLNIQIENEKMAGDALRVLGVAYCLIENGFTEDNINGLSIHELLKHKTDVIWVGFIGMKDPIRTGVKDVIERFHEAGIDTIMITGDQSATAYAIGKELNLSKDDQLEILDSTNLSNMTREVLEAVCQKVNIFSRVSPANKLQVVQALQSVGKVVAMTGDGINDAPALKAADIGVAMGNTGTDVAREVADVILEDDNIQTMIIAISQGRTIYNNIRKSLFFLLSTNLSEIMVMFTSISFGLGQPLNAMQLLWINLISDIAPGLALAIEPPEPDVLSKPPRNPDEPIISSSDFKKILLQSAIISASSLTAYGYGLTKYGFSQSSSALAFMSLSTSQILHSLVCRSEKQWMFKRDTISSNKYLTYAVGGSLLLQSSVLLIPKLRSLLSIGPLNIMDMLVAGSCSMLPMLINEKIK